MNESELIDFNKAIEIPPEYNGSEKKKTMILEGKKVCRRAKENQNQ